MTDHPSPHRRRLLLGAGLLGAAGLAAALMLRAPAPPAAAPLPRVGTALAMRADVPRTIAVIGTVQPIVSAAVRAQLAGTIFSIDVREGQSVAKGQRLARIDPAPLPHRHRAGPGRHSPATPRNCRTRASILPATSDCWRRTPPAASRSTPSAPAYAS